MHLCSNSVTAHGCALYMLHKRPASYNHTCAAAAARIAAGRRQPQLLKAASTASDAGAAKVEALTAALKNLRKKTKQAAPPAPDSLDGLSLDDILSGVEHKPPQRSLVTTTSPVQQSSEMQLLGDQDAASSGSHAVADTLLRPVPSSHITGASAFSTPLRPSWPPVQDRPGHRSEQLPSRSEQQTPAQTPQKPASVSKKASISTIAPLPQPQHGIRQHTELHGSESSNSSYVLPDFAAVSMRSPSANSRLRSVESSSQQHAVLGHIGTKSPAVDETSTSGTILVGSTKRRRGQRLHATAAPAQPLPQPSSHVHPASATQPHIQPHANGPASPSTSVTSISSTAKSSSPSSLSSSPSKRRNNGRTSASSTQPASQSPQALLWKMFQQQLADNTSQPRPVMVLPDMEVQGSSSPGSSHSAVFPEELTIVNGSNWRAHVQYLFPDVFDAAWHNSFYEFLFDFWPAVARAHEKQQHALVKSAYKFVELCFQSKDLRVSNAMVVSFVENMYDYESLISESPEMLPKLMLSHAIVPMAMQVHGSTGLFQDFMMFVQDRLGRNFEAKPKLHKRLQAVLDRAAQLKIVHPAATLTTLVYLSTDGNVS